MKTQLKNGDLRLYFNSEGAVRHYSVGSLDEAVYLFNKLAEGDLSREDIDYNVIDLEIYNEEESEWQTYYNEDGLDFNEILDEMETATIRTFDFSIDTLNAALSKVQDQNGGRKE